ncbi:MAG: hypothetical protein HZC55_20125 [Verrucomicrobia bacterium]|nr:hypothetical protein [Verrucomicrobiota bacterium]
MSETIREYPGTVMLSLFAVVALGGFAASGGLFRALRAVGVRMKTRLSLPMWGLILLTLVALFAREGYSLAKRWPATVARSAARVEEALLREHQPSDTTLPTYQQLVDLHRKRVDSPEFLEVRRRGRLVLLEQKKGLSGWENRRRVVETVRFGGSGVLITATAFGDIVADLGESKQTPVLVVSGVELVVAEGGDSLVGVWKGQLPPFDLLRTPETLLKRYPFPDSDLLEMRRVTGAPEGYNLSWARTINYHLPALGLKPPCTFVFGPDGLTSVKVWPEEPPWKVVRPQLPSTSVISLSERKVPNQSPEPTPGSVTPRAKVPRPE